MAPFARVVIIALMLVVAAAPVRAGDNESIAEAIKAFITSGPEKIGNEADDERMFQIFTYYQERNFKPIWTRDSGAKGKARALLAALKQADEDGLEPTDYNIKDIEERIASINPEELAELDLLMSMTFAIYARDLSQGRVKPAAVTRDNAIVSHGLGTLSLLDGAEDADELPAYIASLRPHTPRYDRLKKALGDYRKIVAAGGWPTIPAAGGPLKPGATSKQVEALRRRLLASGDLAKADAGEGDTYDDKLVAAVKRFQARHGRHADGVVGPSTLKALNVSAQHRVRQMIINLERRRWMRDDFGKFYVFVNLADQELKVVRNTKTIHTTPVVVGKPFHATPVFSALMTYAVINPYWNVPPSIANKEYLPKLRRDPSVLARQNIQVLSGNTVISPAGIDWTNMRRMPYRLRQQPGAKNALGRIKFMFPNRFNVYIHDTPAKSLFAREQRYFSHGCIRAKDPLVLGSFLLKDSGYSLSRIKAVVATGKRTIVTLKRKIPVHITYLTAWVNKDGTVNFRDDIYGRDAKLIAALGLNRR